jgi:hypothetical protein
MIDKATGQQIEDNDYERMQLRRNTQPLTQCQHCFCGEILINGKKHLVCCMCGRRTLKNSITF